MIEATVQGRFPFLGKMRVPGDVITADELVGVSKQVIDALASQKLLVLSGDTSAPGPHDPQAVSHLNARIDKLADQLAKESEARAADAKAATAQIEALKGALGEAVQAAVAKALELAPAAQRAARLKGA